MYRVYIIAGRQARFGIECVWPSFKLDTPDRRRRGTDGMVKKKYSLENGKSTPFCSNYGYTYRPTDARTLIYTHP